MIIFDPLGAETRIVLPDALGPVVHGRVRRFLSETAKAYAASHRAWYWPGPAAKPEHTTIYEVIGLSSAALEQLAGMILANSDAVTLYVRLPNGTAGIFARTAIESRLS